MLGYVDDCLFGFTCPVMSSMSTTLGGVYDDVYFDGPKHGEYWSGIGRISHDSSDKAVNPPEACLDYRAQGKEQGSPIPPFTIELPPDQPVPFLRLIETQINKIVTGKG